MHECAGRPHPPQSGGRENTPWPAAVTSGLRWARAVKPGAVKSQVPESKIRMSSAQVTKTPGIILPGYGSSANIVSLSWSMVQASAPPRQRRETGMGAKILPQTDIEGRRCE